MQAIPGLCEKGFPFLLFVLVLNSSTWQIQCSARQLPQPCGKLQTFSNMLQVVYLCTHNAVCRCDINCDPLRMDKWQKMWFSPSPFHSPSETCWGGGGNEEESVYLSVCLIVLYTLHPCPSAGAKLLKTLLKVSQHLQTKGSHTSVADQRWHGYGEAPWTQCKTFCQRVVRLRDAKPQAETYI